MILSVLTLILLVFLELLQIGGLAVVVYRNPSLITNLGDWEDSLGNSIVKYLALNNRHTFDRLFFHYTSLLFAAIVKTITKNNALFSKKISTLKNDDYLTLGTYSQIYQNNYRSFFISACKQFIAIYSSFCFLFNLF